MYLTKTTNNIRKASQKLDAMYLDEKEKSYYDAQQKFWLDQNALMKEAIEKAKEEGELNSKIEIAKSAILEGFNNQIIAKLTNLPSAQMEKIRKEMKK